MLLSILGRSCRGVLLLLSQELVIVHLKERVPDHSHDHDQNDRKHPDARVEALDKALNEDGNVPLTKM